MGIGGRRPKADGAAVTRHRPRHDWVEIEDRPNTSGPTLPPRRRNGRYWPAWAVQQWAVWAGMPHTIRWSDADWAFAIDTLEIAVRANAPDAGVSAWTELRAREKAMGTTWDARQAMRVRYVPAQQDSDADATVTSLSEYRDL